MRVRNHFFFTYWYIINIPSHRSAGGLALDIIGPEFLLGLIAGGVIGSGITALALLFAKDRQ